MAHTDPEALDARLGRAGGGAPAARTGRTRRRSRCLVAAAAVCCLLTALVTPAAAFDCDGATACKPGFSTTGLTTDTCTACDASCWTGCRECCAKSVFSCADAACPAGTTKRASGVVPAGTACTNTANAVCSECCEAQSCSETTICKFGYVNSGAYPSPPASGCGPEAEKPCLAGPAASSDCCVPLKSVFPTCAVSVPAVGKQALSGNDVSWAFRSTGGFTRFKGKMTGLCFSINLRNDCSAGDPALQSACCAATKQPAFLQVKLPHPDALSGIVGAESRAATLNALDRCRLSYGLATATLNGIKRFPRVVEVAAQNPLPPASAASRVFNIPLSLSSSARSVEFCLFTNSAQSADPANPLVPVDCAWESICGLEDGSVPSPAANPGQDRSLGCQFRLIGKADARVSAPCCTPPMTLTNYDGSRESSASAIPPADGGAGRRRRLFV